MAALKANSTPVDGFAIHAYGGTVAEFRQSVAQQIAIIDNAGYTSKPVYLTEWDRYANPLASDASAQEAASADFVRQGFAALNLWNRIPGNHNVVAMNWFVYDPQDPQGTPPGAGQWDGYSLKYWQNAGNPPGSSGDLYTAFHQQAAAHLAAGLSGTRPLPGGVTILDNFEMNNPSGTFTHPLGYSPDSHGFLAAQSSITNDTLNSFTAAASQHLSIVADANASSWQIRHVSGDGTPASNTPIPLTSSLTTVGFYYMTTAAGISSQMVIDDNGSYGGANTEAGRAQTLIADGQWHYLDWALHTPQDFVPFALTPGSTGVVPTSGYVTIDSLMFYGPNANADVYLDTVGFNTLGSMGVLTPGYVPPPPRSRAT